MKKILIFGGTGGLGSKLIEYLPNFKITALGSKDVDVTDFTAVNNFFKDYNKPEIVINLSGYNYNSPIHKYNKNKIVKLVCFKNYEFCIKDIL